MVRTASLRGKDIHNQLAYYKAVALLSATTNLSTSSVFLKESSQTTRASFLLLRTAGPS